MKGKLVKIKKTIKKVALMLSLTMLHVKSASANALQSSKFATGTMNLLKDLTSTLLWIVPVATVVLIIWQAMRLQNAEDDGEAKPIKKRMRIILICGVGAFLVDVTFNMILRYYQ